MSHIKFIETDSRREAVFLWKEPMTETVSKNFQQWVGDGVTYDYTLSNVTIVEAAHLAVYLDGTIQTITTDYVVGIDAQIATVTFLTPPAGGQRVSIVREEPLEQNTDLTTINTFRAQGFESALDAIVRQIYRLWHRLSRSLSLPDSDLDGSGQFDARSNRIGNVADPSADQDAVTKAFADSNYALQSAVFGNMFQAVYDTDGDGKVNAATTADAVQWSGITSKPTTFQPAVHTHSGSDITDLTAVATSGSYNDLSNKPVIPEVSDVAYGLGWNGNADAPSKNAVYDKIEALVLSGGSGDMTKSIYDSNDDGTVDAADIANAAPWAGLTGVPASFPPSAHSHSASDVSDFSTAADARITAAVGVSVQAHDVDTAKTDVAQSFGAAQGVVPVALTDGASISTDASLSNIFTVTLAGNRTLANPTNLVAGHVYTWIITQDATGSRTLGFGSFFKFLGAAAPILTTTANAVDIITGIADTTSTIRANSGLDYG